MAASGAEVARVLIIDDSSTIRRVVTTALQGAGYAVAAADGGGTGLVEERTFEPDVILLDYSMPGMNGHVFLRELQTLEDTTVPVVLLAARTDPLPDLDSVLHPLGVIDVITKPFAPEAIVAVVGYALEKHGRRDRGDRTRVVTELASFVAPEQPPKLPDDAAEAVDVFADALTQALTLRGAADAGAVTRLVLADLAGRDAGLTLEDAARRMGAALTGDLSAVPLPEVLQLLKFQTQTGVLDIRLDGSPRMRFEVGLVDGSVVSLQARNVRSDFQLGRYFVAGGLVDEQTLDIALAQPSTRPIGQRLVDGGHMTPDALRRCLGEQAQDLMYELLRARSGFFALRRGAHLLPATVVQPGFSIDQLLFEGLRRVDEWRVIETEVPSFDRHFVRASLDDSGLTPDELLVLGLFANGEHQNVHAVVDRSRLRAFDACRILYRLAALKRIQLVDGAERTVDDTPPLLGARLQPATRERKETA